MTPMTHAKRLQPELIPGLLLPARLPAGFVLGAYVVDGWHRDGATAAIYRAYGLTDARRVAVKLQLPSSVRDPSVGDRFEREAEMLWRVRGSAHVIELVDVGVLDDGRRYLVLEWLDGEDLAEHLGPPNEQGETDEPLPLVDACRIAREVARGLVGLHEHGVGHLGLQPAHVMLHRDEDGTDELVLVGFGSANELREPDAPEPRTPVRRPRSEAPTPASDVLGLGMLLFTMIAGWAPEGWPPEMLPRVDALRHGVPPALAELVRACTCATPRQRPASAKVVAAMLDAIVGALQAAEQEPAAALHLVAPEPAAALAPIDAPEPMATLLPMPAPAPTAAAPQPTAGDTVVAPVLGGFVADVGPGDTMIAPVLEGVGAAESTAVAPLLEGVEPDDTAVLAVGPETAGSSMIGGPTEDADDTAVLMEVGPDLQASPTLYPMPYVAPAEGSAPELEWLARQERSWVPWVVVAGTVAVLGTTATWLLELGRSDETTPAAELRPVPSRAPDPVPTPVAAATQASTPTEAVPPERTGGEGKRKTEGVELEGDGTEHERGNADRAPSPSHESSPPPKAVKARAASLGTEGCDETRAQAEAAQRARAWRGVLKATARWRCWGTATLRVERARLRVAALAELGELEQCVKVGSKHDDREIAARTALCRKKLGA